MSTHGNTEIRVEEERAPRDRGSEKACTAHLGCSGSEAPLVREPFHHPLGAAEGVGHQQVSRILQTYNSVISCAGLRLRERPVPTHTRVWKDGRHLG